MEDGTDFFEIVLPKAKNFFENCEGEKMGEAPLGEGFYYYRCKICGQWWEPHLPHGYGGFHSYRKCKSPF